MHAKKLRKAIADEAARLIVSGRESDFTVAKRRAARILGVRFSTDDFPSTREIRDACQQIEDLSEAGRIDVDPRRMQVAALRVMRRLRDYSPRLVGPVAEGVPRTGGETAIDVQADSIDEIRHRLAVESLDRAICECERDDSGGPRLGVLRLRDEYDIKVRVFARGRADMNGISLEELRQSLEATSPNLESELDGMDAIEDRFEILEDLARGLEHLRRPSPDHPEGDVLHHSLQLFDLARRERDYDEEFLTAALMHDVGAMTRSPEPMRESRKLLDRIVTRRTLALIWGMELALREPPLSAGEIEAAVGADNVDDVLLLARLDRLARKPGAVVATLESAVEHLRSLDRGEEWAPP